MVLPILRTRATMTSFNQVVRLVFIQIHIGCQHSINESLLRSRPSIFLLFFRFGYVLKDKRLPHLPVPYIFNVLICFRDNKVKLLYFID